MGEDVTLLIGGPYGDHRYGHIALRVFGKSYDFTFDFGRYGISWGVGGTEGEGMLRVWEDSFDRYIFGENLTGRTTKGYTYNTSDKVDMAVLQFYKNKLKGLVPITFIKFKRKFKGKMTKYKLMQDYHWAKFNCTIISIMAFEEGIGVKLPVDNKGRGMNIKEKIAGKVAGWPNLTFMPFDLQNVLEGNEIVSSVEEYKFKKE
jgi:hypothetical protein